MMVMMMMVVVVVVVVVVVMMMSVTPFELKVEKLRKELEGKDKTEARFEVLPINCP